MFNSAASQFVTEELYFLIGVNKHHTIDECIGFGQFIDGYRPNLTDSSDEFDALLIAGGIVAILEEIIELGACCNFLRLHSVFLLPICLHGVIFSVLIGLDTFSKCPFEYLQFYCIN